MVSYIWTNFTSEQLRKHFCSTCTPNFRTKALTNIGASESKFKMHYHDGEVCLNCMHTTCNSRYIVRAGAVCSTSKKPKYVIRTHTQNVQPVCTGSQPDFRSEQIHRCVCFMGHAQWYYYKSMRQTEGRGVCLSPSHRLTVLARPSRLA